MTLKGIWTWLVGPREESKDQLISRLESELMTANIDLSIAEATLKVNEEDEYQRKMEALGIVFMSIGIFESAKGLWVKQYNDLMKIASDNGEAALKFEMKLAERKKKPKAKKPTKKKKVR